MYEDTPTPYMENLEKHFEEGRKKNQTPIPSPTFSDFFQGWHGIVALKHPHWQNPVYATAPLHIYEVLLQNDVNAI